MPGEPTGVFDAPTLQIIETVALGVEQPSNVVDVGESIKLRVTVQGLAGNLEWENLKTQNSTIFTPPNDGNFLRADFYAEGMGPGVPNQSFGGPVDLRISNTDTHTIDTPPLSIGTAGVYRCGVMVHIVTKNGAATTAKKGWLAFNEQAVLQVHAEET